MVSLFRYPFKHGVLRASVNNGKVQLFENSKLVDECISNDNTLLYDIHVGYTDIPCDVHGKYRTMMFLETNELRTYTFKEVLSALVKDNNIPVEKPAIMPDDWTFDDPLHVQFEKQKSNPITPSANMENFDY